MTTANIYLKFDGTCEAAFSYYKSVLGGEIPFMGRFSEMPSESGYFIPDEHKNRVMHCTLVVNETLTIQGSDIGGVWAAGFIPGNNFSVSLNVDSKEEADRVFNALLDGGDIILPMQNTFWNSYFGNLIDKFGIGWMISYNLPQ